MSFRCHLPRFIESRQDQGSNVRFYNFTATIPRTLLLLTALLLFLACAVMGFAPIPVARNFRVLVSSTRSINPISSALHMANNDDEPKVNVKILDNIDAVTLTAVGFALIAANFFIFANMGDGGIAGLVASIINNSRY